MSKETFQDIVVGILLYAVILGFFNDYTDIVHINSFTFVFLMAVVLQILTMLTLALKRLVVRWLHTRQWADVRIAVIGAVWLIMFGSKFVFLAAIEILLGNSVSVSGAFGLMAVILIMSTTKYAVERISATLR